MNISYDYHLHSAFSADSSTPAEAMIERALALGMKGICFTEHMDPDCPSDGPDFTIDFSSYFSTLMELRDRYQDRISICIGMEFGIMPHLAGALDALCAQYPFDFIIASQHFVDGRDPYYPAYFEGRTERTCYEEFFTCEYNTMKQFSSYDTLGHLDYVVRYGPNQNQFYSYASYADYIDPILKQLIKQDKCLEINAGGLRHGLGEPNPSSDILKRYRELGGTRITIGSDAHSPEYIGSEFKKIAALLGAAGFQYYTVFKNRKPEMIPL